MKFGKERTDSQDNGNGPSAIRRRRLQLSSVFQEIPLLLLRGLHTQEIVESVHNAFQLVDSVPSG